MYLKTFRWIVMLLPVTLFAGPLFDLNFTSAEGFTEGVAINGINGMAAQAPWTAGDVGGTGYAVCTGPWWRAEHGMEFQLGVGESAIVETTIRLQDADGSFTNGELAQVGFAEKSLHSGNSIPSIGSKLSCTSTGAYWFGAANAAERIDVPASMAGDWIKFTQTITRSSVTNEFTGKVSAFNVTKNQYLGEAVNRWVQTTSDGSWGGGMNAAFRMLGNAGVTAVEIDRFKASTVGVPSALHFMIDPEVSVSIGGHLDLDRKQFINLADSGRKMENAVSSATKVNEYVSELGLNFGRELGGAYGVTGWNTAAVKEDVNRPGYVDIANLSAKTNPDNGGTSQWIVDHYAPNLGVATHDRYGAYPSFMPTWVATGDDPDHKFPVNVDAAGEYIAGVLEHNYTDWTRPATYEPINEPDWRVWGDQRFADLHTAVKQKVDQAGLDVAVGGPCLSVGYFYKSNYQSFSLKNFINNTGCGLDFYSFHVYDFMRWDAASSDFKGRVSTGLPIEGVLDLVQGYTRSVYGKNVDMVLSEHGGYVSTDQEGALDTVANTYFPGSGFDWEMKRRSVSEHLAVSSAIANTMAFMNNPHVIRKAVPFILLESASWDPEYYSTLLVKENFDKTSNVWRESTYVNFFKFFKNVKGRRVLVAGGDPDVQMQAYADGQKLYVLMNNLSTKAETLSFNLPVSGMEGITMRRFSRMGDFTPLFEEQEITTLDGLILGGREALALEISYARPFVERVWRDEVPYYADLQQQQFTGSKTFQVAVPEHAIAQSAKLRIGVGRSPGTDRDLDVVFNGVALEVPMEDCASYLEDGSDYGSTKLLDVPMALLQANNTVEVSFPGNGTGGVGTVVIRAVLDRSHETPVVAVNCGGAAYVADDGTAYAADAYFSASSTGVDSNTEIGNTADDELYRRERWGADFSYDMPVSNGEYEVLLQFAENWHNAANLRVFDVNIEGVPVISGLDLYKVTGRSNAYDRVFRTNVSDGILNVVFHATTNNAKINGIRVRPVVPAGVGLTYSDWVAEMGLSEHQAGRSLDLDGDGWDNEREFSAGTDPKDGQNYHRAAVVPRPGGFAVVIDSKVGRSYTVEISEDLSAGWTNWISGISGTGELIELLDTSHHEKCFYRVRVGVE